MSLSALDLVLLYCSQHFLDDFWAGRLEWLSYVTSAGAVITGHGVQSTAHILDIRMASLLYENAHDA